MVKKRYIRNGIVFDPNIAEDMFDMGWEQSQKNRRIYRKGRAKRKRYFGI